MAAWAAHAFGRLVQARNRAYDRGRLGVARLPAPVVSIGNLSVGGRAKTPMVIALGAALAEAGLGFDVLSRGYRRQRHDLQIAATGGEDPAWVGDEPLLIARRLRRPVLVHPDRFRAGLEGERRFASQLHLLDDGFQHRQLARAFDLVMVAPEDLDGRLLPAGRLREPPAALARAQAVVWLAPGPLPPAAAQAAVRHRLAAFTAAPVYFARKRALPPEHDGGPRPLAFCGLAQPESFWASLAEVGITPAGCVAFADHHRYRGPDLRRLQQRARALGATGFITTRKDAVKLPREFGAVAALDLDLEVEGLATLLGQVRASCGL